MTEGPFTVGRKLTLEAESTRRITFDLVPFVVPRSFVIAATFANGQEADAVVIVDNVFGDHDPAQRKPLPHPSVVGITLSNDARRPVLVDLVLVFDVEVSQ